MTNCYERQRQSTRTSPNALTTLNNTHILDFLDERIFPFKDHKEQLSTFFGSWPLVNVVNHTRLGTEERERCHLAWAAGKESTIREHWTLAPLTASWRNRAKNLSCKTPWNVPEPRPCPGSHTL